MRNSNQYENKNHGTYDFPLEYYYVNNEHPRYIMNAHLHEEFEIIRILKGRFDLYVNNIVYTLSEGDFFLIECGNLHRGVPKDCVYECIVFNLNMLFKGRNDTISKYISPLISNDVRINQLIHNDSTFKETIATLFLKAGNKQPFYEFEIYSILFSLFGQLYKKNNVISFPKSQHNHQTLILSEILDWINKHYAENISLERVAEHAGLSKKYLCRIFKKYTDKTIIGYINELKVENACYQIISMNKSITQAALDCGFNDISYFSKTFKKYMGITPLEFKKTIS